jgi:hypothetical protein
MVFYDILSETAQFYLYQVYVRTAWPSVLTVFIKIISSFERTLEYSEILDIVRMCFYVVWTACRDFPNSVDFWNPTPCWILIDLASGRCCSDVRTSSSLSAGHWGVSGRLKRSVRTVAQEPAVLTWKLHGIFMDIFLETCDHTHGMKWDTVHITWRLWIEPIILLKSNCYIKCFCQLECCQYKILTSGILKRPLHIKKSDAKKY